uniref:NADH-ubiquinone oxidoreductase chain 1 n=1 Tax=Myrmecophilus manni TaxID=270849 RepID=B6DE99_9ORTH|nr:NADH dehydrogenase subunit 1 [Myrmecophilus manni]ACG59295.1 NADH dehydrogenase subunit 1 [Myrmecophilus manni]
MFLYNLRSLLFALLLMVGVLVGVAFLTLLERSVLGYIQVRSGPNSVGFMGMVQPFSDAVKLFSKECLVPWTTNYYLYYISPVMGLFLSLLLWMIFPYLTTLLTLSFGLLFFLCVISAGVYPVMIAGWSSNSNYALLGSLRSVAQSISYEVSLALILLSLIILNDGFSLLMFTEYQRLVWLLMCVFPLGLSWLSTCLAETNRTPFDLAEGESELVSGFNIEYSSGGFSIIFLAEYSSILFMSMLFSLMLLGGNVMSIAFYLSLLFISFLFVWVRGTLPRFRYDKLMSLAWKSYLPLSLNFVGFFLGFKVFLMVIA